VIDSIFTHVGYLGETAEPGILQDTLRSLLRDQSDIFLTDRRETSRFNGGPVVLPEKGCTLAIHHKATSAGSLVAAHARGLDALVWRSLSEPCYHVVRVDTVLERRVGMLIRAVASL